MNKFLGIFVAVSIVLSSFCFFDIKASAVKYDVGVNSNDEKYKEYNGFKYVITDDGVVIKECTLKDSDIVVPDRIDDKPVVEIGDFVFGNNKKLVSIKLPDTISKLGKSVFIGCSSLKSVNIPASVVEIGDWAFGDNKNLVSIKLPDTISKLGQAAFYGCKSLKSVNIPASLTEISDQAFQNCRSLESITLGNNIQTIGEFAFSGCFSLKKLDIPDNVRTLKKNAFWECQGIETIKIGKGVTSIVSPPFEGCSGLKSYIIDNNNKVYKSIDGVLYSKDGKILYDYPKGKAAPSELVIPDGVTEIGHGAFWGISSFTRVKFPDTLETIGEHAFHGCSGITEVVLPENTVNVNNFSFIDCSNLEKVVFGNKITRICYGVFASCPKLKEIIWGESIAEIGSAAFRGDNALESVTIPKTVTLIGRFAFYECENLKKVKILCEDFTLSSSAFDEGVSIDMKIPERVTISPDTVSTVKAPDPFSAIDVVYAWNDYVKYLFIGSPDPDTKATIKVNDYAISDCKNLETVVIGYGVKKLKSEVFANCNKLSTLVIMDKNVKLDSLAFLVGNKYKGIKNIYFGSSKKDWEKKILSKTDDVVKLQWKKAKIYYNCKFAQITAQPENISAKNGKRVKLAVEASGDGLKYQWQYLKNDEWIDVKNGTKSTLSVKMSESAVRTWRCVVTDKYGISVTSNEVKTELE